MEDSSRTAAVACVTEDYLEEAEVLPLYNLKQKERVEDVIINPALTTDQKKPIKSCWRNTEIYISDVPKVTLVIKNKFLMAQMVPITDKSYPTPYKIQNVVGMNERFRHPMSLC